MGCAGHASEPQGARHRGVLSCSACLTAPPRLPLHAVGDADLGDESDEDDSNPENAGKTAMFEDFFGPRTGGELPYFPSESAPAAAVYECRLFCWCGMLGVPLLLSKLLLQAALTRPCAAGGRQGAAQVTAGGGRRQQQDAFEDAEEEEEEEEEEGFEGEQGRACRAE